LLKDLLILYEDDPLKFEIKKPTKGSELTLEREASSRRQENPSRPPAAIGSIVMHNK
jgi:hypothetical protein